LPFPDTSRLE